MLSNCDCGACCEQCGHYPGCIRNEIKSEEDMDEDKARLKSGLLTVPEVAEALRLSRSSVYPLIHNGELGAHKVGGVFRVPEAELLAYLKRTATATIYDEEE